MSGTGRQLLDELARRHAELAEGVLDEGFEPPAPLDLPSAQVLSPDDLEAARTVLADLEAAQARLVGQRVRLAGEMAASRRPVRDARRPAPRVFDTAI